VQAEGRWGTIGFVSLLLRHLSEGLWWHHHLGNESLVGSASDFDAGWVGDCRKLAREAARRRWFVDSIAVAEWRTLG